jgi:phytoene/squalene synthetase
MEQSRAITRKSASNLALAFVLLPRAKRESMSALYAFCREVDDVADEETQPVERRRQRLAAWREDVRRACEGTEPEFPVNIELQPVIKGIVSPSRISTSSSKESRWTWTLSGTRITTIWRSTATALLRSSAF